MIKHPDGPILRISKKGKGVDLVAEVYWEHPAIRSFEVTDEIIKDEEVSTKPTKGPVITEYYAVCYTHNSLCRFQITETVISLFNSVDRVSKGLLLTTADCRALITQYVKTEVCFRIISK